MIKDMDVNYEDYHKLTQQQQRFCDEYLVHFNAFKAAVAAGYSDNTARRGDLVHLPKIQLYLRGAMNRTQQRLQITQDMVLHELAKVAFSNMANYYDEYDALKPLSQLTNDQKAAISHYEILDSRDEEGYRAGKFGRIKLHNKMAALDKIARHIGFYGLKEEKQESRIRNQESREEGFRPEVGKSESREAFEESQESRIKNQEDESCSSSCTGSPKDGKSESCNSSGTSSPKDAQSESCNSSGTSSQEDGKSESCNSSGTSSPKDAQSESRKAFKSGSSSLEDGVSGGRGESADGDLTGVAMECLSRNVEEQGGVSLLVAGDSRNTEGVVVCDRLFIDEENGVAAHCFADGVAAAELDDPDGEPAPGFIRGWLPAVDIWGGDSDLVGKIEDIKKSGNAGRRFFAEEDEANRCFVNGAGSEKFTDVA